MDCPPVHYVFGSFSPIKPFATVLSPQEIHLPIVFFYEHLYFANFFFRQDTMVLQYRIPVFFYEKFRRTFLCELSVTGMYMHTFDDTF